MQINITKIGETHSPAQARAAILVPGVQIIDLSDAQKNLHLRFLIILTA